MPTLTDEETAYLDRYEGQWVKVTRGKYLVFQEHKVVIGRVIGWHWYDGVILHVQPPKRVDWREEPYEVAFEFDTIELLPLASQEAS
jgi:hypothetical protein